LYPAAPAVERPRRDAGIGLPVPEAIAHGCPGFVSPAAALDEVAPAAAPRVSPDDVSGWVTAINAVLADPEARAVLSASGRAEAQRYDPGRTARGLIDAWEQALT
jgi:glycosyltransferase involved in cell wall biosynthesis